MFSRATQTATADHSNTYSSLFHRNEESSSFIQPKLNMGKVGDKYEIEADRAADQIVAKGNESSTPFIAPAPSIQKQTEEDVQKQENETEVQQKPLVEKITPGVQLKAEEEIQQKKTESNLQAKEQISSVESINTTPDLKPVVQKQTEKEVQSKEDEEVQEKEEENVQKQSTSAGDDGSNIESQLSDSKGGGSPMDSGTQSEMKSGFGADFSGVRVHNDSNAIQMNQELGSQAFTNGNDIYFNEGKYNPDSDSGKHLLAHELTHTVQQGASPNSNVQKSSIVQQEEAKEPSKPGQPTSVIDLSNGLKLSKDWLEYVEDRPFNDKRYSISSSKIKNLGWKPERNLLEDLPSIIEWYNKNYNLFK